MKNLVLTLGMAYSILGPVTQNAVAQTWPTRVIRLIVPLAPGGSTDIMARVVAQKLEQEWGQSVLIENRAGASTIIGTDLVAKAAPDGYTILVAASPYANNVALYPGKLPYDINTDFAPIALISTSPLLLVIHGNLPVKSVSEFVAFAKSNPGKMNFASASVGGVTHLAGEYFKMAADIKAVHIAYKGNAPALTDLVAGRVDFIFNGPVSLIPFIKSGKIRPLAASSRKRVTSFPDVPTMEEVGYKGFEANGWLGFVGQAKLPHTIINKFNTSTNRALQHPDVVQRIESDGSVAGQGTPEDFGAFLLSENIRWTKVIKAANVTPD